MTICATTEPSNLAVDKTTIRALQNRQAIASICVELLSQLSTVVVESHYLSFSFTDLTTTPRSCSALLYRFSL